MFQKMQEHFYAMQKPTTADRIIEVSGVNSTDPEERINARLLQNAANDKANEADRALIRAEKAKVEAKAKAKPKGKVEAKAKAAAPPPQDSDSGESDHETSSSSHTQAIGTRSDESAPCKLDLGSDANASTSAPPEQNQTDSESSDGEPVSPKRKRQCKESLVKSAEQESIVKSPEREETTDEYLALIHPETKVLWSSACEEKDKADLIDAIEETAKLLQTCECYAQLQLKLRNLDWHAKWSNCYETNYDSEEWAVYMHRKSPRPYTLGDRLCRISLIG